MSVYNMTRFSFKLLIIAKCHVPCQHIMKSKSIMRLKSVILINKYNYECHIYCGKDAKKYHF